MIVYLNKFPSKTVVMDVIVADIPPKFIILLSRSWTLKLEGSLQMDMTYATIPLRNENKRLYIKRRFPYVVSSQAHPDIHHVYVIDTDLGSSIFFNDISPCNSKIVVPQKDKKETSDLEALERKQKDEGLWKMYFDGSVAKVGAGAGVYIISPIEDTKAYSYKLIFECSNNVAEYEALLLGLHALKDLEAKRVQFFWDLELVVNQVNDSY